MISLKGIDHAIFNLNYQNKASLKYRFVSIVRENYENEGSVASLTDIHADELVKALWDTGEDPDLIKKKRKSLSGLKSSVNSDFKKLFKDGKNPEGVVIGRNNIFTMSDEAKDQILTSFSNSMKVDRSASLAKIAEVLNIVTEMLADPEVLDTQDSSEDSNKLEQLKNIIRGLSEKIESVEDLEEITKEDESILVEDEIIEEEELADDEKIEIFEELDEDCGTEQKDLEAEAVEELEAGEDLDAVIEEDVEVLDADEVVEEGDLEDEVEEEDLEGEAVEELEAGEDLDVAIEEDVEVLDADEVAEEGELEDEVEEVGFEAEEGEGGDFGETGSDYFIEDETDVDEKQKAKLLSEEFETYLSARERFYNQYFLIPGGIYIVGSKVPQENEIPEKRVPIEPFYIGKFPITNALFEIFIEETGYRTTAQRVGFGMVYSGRYKRIVNEITGAVTVFGNSGVQIKRVPGACWYQPNGPGSTLHQKRNHPVVQVSIEDAMAFAAWTGKRLPTEKEWEAATRTAKGFVLPWGNEWRKNCCNIEDSHIGDTASVEEYKDIANDFGIVDILGNVLEWTLDICEAPPHSKNDSKYHIVKGGSWLSGPEVRLFNRFIAAAEATSNILGFRCLAF
jgi:formylglycine-generating enzyme required for sulfatase activity